MTPAAGHSFAGSEHRPHIATRILLWVAVAHLIMMSDPTDRAFGLSTTLQFIPAAVGLATVIVSLVSGVRSQLGLVWQDGVFGLIWLAAFSGSLATVLSGHPLSESYMNLAVAMLLYVPFRLLSGQPEQVRWFMGRFARWLVALSALISLELILWAVAGPFFETRAGIGHIFHEEVYLLAGACVAAAFRYQDRPLLRVACVGLMLAGMIFSFKNTGFIVLIATVLILLAIPVTGDTDQRRHKNLLRAMGVFYVGLACAAFLITLPFFVQHLPTGSLQVRLFTYATRLREFAEAPLLGNLFAGSPHLAVPSTNLYIPSHSDALDLLANVGLLGASLFAIAIGGYVAALARIRTARDLRAEAFVLYALFLGQIVVWLFNPVWLQPKMGGLFWMTIALLTGVNGLLRRMSSPAPAGARNAGQAAEI